MRTLTKGLLLSILLLYALTGLVTSQGFDIEEFAANAVLVENDGIPVGSGCFYQQNNYAYFATAKHVLFNMKDNSFLFQNHVLTLIWYPYDIYGTSEPSKIVINMKDSVLSKYVLQIPNHDIALIKIGFSDSISTLYYDFVKRTGRYQRFNSFHASFVNEYKHAQTGNDIYLFGYPISIGLKETPQYDVFRPLVRKGSIAGRNNSRHSVIIDCPIYKGNSGGPVLCTYLDSNIRIGFLGIVVEFIPLQQEWVNLQFGLHNVYWENSGYGIVEPFDVVVEYLQNIK